LPDIFGILSEKRDFASFINADHILNLKEYMEADDLEWKNKFFEEAISVNEFKADNNFGVPEGIYGVPIDITNIQFLYNKRMFREAGLDPEKPPRTWKEFIEVGKKLNAAGFQGLVSGFGEIWLLDCLSSIYAYNIMGEDKVLATIKGDVLYTDPDWVKVLSLFDEMRNNNLLATGTISMVNKTAEQMFANERAAINFDGSWAVNVYNGMNKNLEYGVMPPPIYSTEHPAVVWGGAGSSFMVNKKSKLKEEAIKFLKWITDAEQQIYLAETTRNIPSNKDAVENIPTILKEFIKDTPKIVHPGNYSYSEFPSVLEVLNKGIQSIIIGEKKPIDVLTEVQRVKDREISRI
jgi:ABC-type glycerol-3-phosphate transport system substrate-binding protein